MSPDRMRSSAAPAASTAAHIVSPTIAPMVAIGETGTGSPAAAHRLAYSIQTGQPTAAPAPMADECRESGPAQATEPAARPRREDGYEQGRRNGDKPAELRLVERADLADGINRRPQDHDRGKRDDGSRN